MSNFREFDRETGFLLPPSLDEWLPEQHLARFVVEVIARPILIIPAWIMKRPFNSEVQRADFWR